MSEEKDIIIKTKGVKVNFGDFWALKGIDVEVRKGEIIVILGPSGSGKSTFIRTLNRLQPHSAGNIEIEGIEISEKTSVANLKKVRADVGFVFQQFNLPHLTIMENITLAPMKVKGMTKAEAERNAMELLERVGIPEQAYKYPSGLSGGQQQRVAIARAFWQWTQRSYFSMSQHQHLIPEMIKEVLDVMVDLAKSNVTMIVRSRMRWDSPKRLVIAAYFSMKDT